MKCLVLVHCAAIDGESAKADQSALHMHHVLSRLLQDKLALPNFKTCCQAPRHVYQRHEYQGVSHNTFKADMTSNSGVRMLSQLTCVEPRLLG